MKRGISLGSVDPSASSITPRRRCRLRTRRSARLPPLARLMDDLYVGPQPEGLLRRVVDRMSVDDDHLMEPGRKPGEHVAEVPGLVAGRDHDADQHLRRGWPNRLLAIGEQLVVRGGRR